MSTLCRSQYGFERLALHTNTPNNAIITFPISDGTPHHTTFHPLPRECLALLTLISTRRCPSILRTHPKVPYTRRCSDTATWAVPESGGIVRYKPHSFFLLVMGTILDCSLDAYCEWAKSGVRVRTIRPAETTSGPTSTSPAGSGTSGKTSPSSES